MKLKLCSKRKKVLLAIFLFLGVFAINAQTMEITGTVLDDSGVPLPGVAVLVKNTTKGVSTDLEGKFVLLDVQKGETLIFSYVGYKTIERVVNTSNSINVSLQPDAQILDEVVVTALGIKREEKALGYAVQEMKGETLQKVQWC